MYHIHIFGAVLLLANDVQMKQFSEYNRNNKMRLLYCFEKFVLSDEIR